MKGTDLSKGGRPAKHSNQSSGTTSLHELGLSKDQSSKFQQLANVPEDEFERVINIGGTKPGMKLQRRERGQDWKSYRVNRKVVKSPVDIEILPPGRYQLV